MRAAQKSERPPVAVLAHALDPHRSADCALEAGRRRIGVARDASSALRAMPGQFWRVDAEQPDTLPAAVERIAIHNRTPYHDPGTLAWERGGSCGGRGVCQQRGADKNGDRTFPQCPTDGAQERMSWRVSLRHGSATWFIHSEWHSGRAIADGDRARSPARQRPAFRGAWGGHSGCSSIRARTASRAGSMSRAEISPVLPMSR